MILEPIDAESFALARRRLHRSPAACRAPQLIRLALLIGMALAVFALNPGRVLAADSSASTIVSR